MRHVGYAPVSVILPLASRFAWQAFRYQYNLLISGYRLGYLQLIVVLAYSSATLEVEVLFDLILALGAFFKPTKDISGRREISVLDQFPLSGGNS